jgi:hypothetical protein
MGKSRRKKPASPVTPQRGRAENLLDSVKNSFTPEVVHRASSMVGETEAATRRTLEASANKVVAGLSRLISSREGPENLQALLETSAYQSLAGNVPALFSGGNATSSAASAGEQLLGRLFGSASPVTEQVAVAGAVKTASARKLLALVAPLALGLLAKGASADALNTSEIASLLTGANAEADAADGPLDETPRRRRWGPILVPKQRKEDVRPETFDDRADELPFEPESTTAQRGPAPHRARRIVFLLAALAALALLILLLIRGPARPRSHNAHSDTWTMSRASLSTARALASVEPRECPLAAIKAGQGCACSTLRLPASLDKMLH